MMKLMYITPEPEIAKAAQTAGVDWIFVDLETLGKHDRQGHLDTVISRHTIDDVKAVRSVLSNSQLLVRTNPLHNGSVSEIDSVIAAGADIVMLPFFTTADEVIKFLSIVDGRAQTCLLLETPEAVDNLADVVELSGIDYVHIGLNDLHLGYDLDFMFEPLINGTVDHIASMLRQSGVEFGFGGIARLGEGTLAAERILAEHRRVGSNMVILSRSFLNTTDSAGPQDLEILFRREVQRIRHYEAFLQDQTEGFFVENRVATAQTANRIVQDIRG